MKDLELLRLFRQEQDNFRKHLALKDQEILNLKSLLSRNGQSNSDQVLENDSQSKDDLQLKTINDLMSVDSDSVPYFESVQQFKTWISNLQNTKTNQNGMSTEAQTDKILLYSLLSLFAKELQSSRKLQISSNNLQLTDLHEKYHNTIKHLNYQMQVNADVKKLIVESVIGSHISNNYSFWGSDPDINRNILDLYNDALVTIGKLNFKIDDLESQNVQLNQIMEELVMALSSEESNILNE